MFDVEAFIMRMDITYLEEGTGFGKNRTSSHRHPILEDFAWYGSAIHHFGGWRV
jgi:hypothetical protein